MRQRSFLVFWDAIPVGSATVTRWRITLPSCRTSNISSMVRLSWCRYGALAVAFLCRRRRCTATVRRRVRIRDLSFEFRQRRHRRISALVTIQVVRSCASSVSIMSKCSVSLWLVVIVYMFPSRMNFTRSGRRIRLLSRHWRGWPKSLVTWCSGTVVQYANISK